MYGRAYVRTYVRTYVGVRLNLGGEMFSEAYNLMSEKCPLPTENVSERIKLRGRSISDEFWRILLQSVGFWWNLVDSGGF